MGGLLWETSALLTLSRHKCSDNAPNFGELAGLCWEMGGNGLTHQAQTRNPLPLLRATCAIAGGIKSNRAPAFYTQLFPLT